MNDDGDAQQSTETPQLPLSQVRKALKRLGLEGIKTHEIQEFFDDEEINRLREDVIANQAEIFKNVLAAAEAKVGKAWMPRVFGS